MKPQPLAQLHAALTRLGIVTVHLAELPQHIAAFVGKVLRHIQTVCLAGCNTMRPGAMLAEG
jgi:hypothetical protein